MARSWTRLHEHLGLPPGPITYSMVQDAVTNKLAETDDLDWKENLPAFAPKPGLWNEFAKDVAAMANTRGGLLIYGVTDAVVLVGIDLTSVKEQQMLQTVRNGIQPYISGIDIIPLPAPGGAGPDVLVVDVPPSPSAPHFQYGWEQKDKDRATFNAPYRIKDDTGYMLEHQVARAYQERFTRQEAAATLLQRYINDATEAVLAESQRNHTWLIVAGLPSRPVPRLVPAPTREEARAVLEASLSASQTLNGPRFRPRSVLREALDNNMRVGLRRWVDSNFLVADRRTQSRDVMVELHHDGTAVLCADLSWGLEDSRGIPLDTWALGTLIGEAIALFETHRQRRTPDSAVEISATIAVNTEEVPPSALLPYDTTMGFKGLHDNMRHPRRILPATTELPPASDLATLHSCVHELEAGLLHQFGFSVPPPPTA